MPLVEPLRTSFGLLSAPDSPDLEANEIERGGSLVDGGAVDLHTRGIAKEPLDHLAHSFGFTLEACLHSTILGIAHPTTQAKLLCLTPQTL
jgi:hypothetical protein